MRLGGDGTHGWFCLFNSRVGQHLRLHGYRGVNEYIGLYGYEPSQPTGLQ